MDFGEKIAKAASELRKPPTKPEPKPETIQPPEPTTKEATPKETILKDGSRVKVGDTLEILMSGGTVIATPKVEKIISSHELLADGSFIDTETQPYCDRIRKKI